MNRFVVVVTARGRLRPSTLHLLDADDSRHLPFRPERHVRWVSRDESVHYAGWEHGREPRSHRSPTGLVAFAGAPRPTRTAWSPTRSVIDQLVDHAAVADWRPRLTLGDAYTVVRLRPDGSGFIAGDPMGMHPLYVGAGSGVTVIGNRCDLVAHTHAAATGRPVEKSVTAASWLAFAGQHIGAMTGFDGVVTVEHDTIVEVAAGETEMTAIRPAFETADREDITDPVAVGETLADAVAVALGDAIARSSEPPRVELTGGKDSRLVLAAAMRAGLTAGLQFVTYGPAEPSPDMMVATAIAQRFGLDHLDISPEHFAPAMEFSITDRYRRHVHRSGGASHCGDANEPAGATVPVISGHIGELFRTAGVAPPDRQPEDIGAATRRFLRRRQFGAAGLLAPAVAADHRLSITAYFEAPRNQVRRPNELDVAYIMRCRYPRWQGPLVDLHATRRLPLYAPAAVHDALLMQPDDLHLERVHFHIVNAASPELAAMPFANDSWRGNEMPKPEPVTGLKSAKQFGVSATREHRDIVSSYPHSPLWGLVDRHAVHAAMDRFADLRPLEIHQLLGTITALIWLGDDELPSR